MRVIQSSSGEKPMAQDEEITKNLTLLEYYKEQLANLDMQQQYLQAALLDYQKAKITIENLGKEQGENDLLIPVGSGVFISAVSTNTDKVLIDIGADLVVEKPVNEAIKNIDTRMEMVQENQKKLLTMAQQLQTEAEALSQRTQDMMARNQQQ